MKFNTIYNLCLGCILLVFFAVSFTLGTIIYANGYDAEPADTETSVLEQDEPCPNIDSQESHDSELASELNVVDGDNTREYYDITLCEGDQEYVCSVCEEYNVPCDLVFAIMSIESDFDSDEVSDNDDWGVMQINIINHEMLKNELGVTDFLDFRQNVLCGVYILSGYYKEYHDINKIAMCYRYGESGAKAMWEKGIYETEYTGRIIRAIADLNYR